MENQATKEANISTEIPEESGSGLTRAKAEILVAIHSLKSEFSTRLDGFLHAVEENRKELVECTKRITQAEVR